jgi:glycerophosphoryl diester phosphodiesterase
MRPEIIAHRGARSLAPENTLLAAKKAFELGADLWETDVGVSKDGVPILMHDDALTRTTDAARRFPDRTPWTFTTFTLAELKALDAGSWFLETDPFGELARGGIGEKAQEAIRGALVPTLEEALRLTQALGWQVNLELKRQPPPMEDFPLLEAVFAVIDAVGLGPGAVVLSSFDLDLMRAARKMRPEFRVQAVLGFHRDRPIDWEAAADFDELNPRASLTPPAVVERLSNRGKALRPWTVNEADEARAFIEAGVAGLFTDFPQRLVPLVG